MFNDIQIDKYMHRIEYIDKLTPNIETLCKLQWAHLTHIPYENLDILKGKPISLKIQDLFEKIIEHNRGGYCFELQGLYGYLLQSIGFHVVQYAARFMDEPNTIQMRRHRILVVEEGKDRYLTDVGVRSESPRRPLELIISKIQTDGICQYKFEKDYFYGWVLYQKEYNKDWKAIYGFTEEIQIDDDYIMPSFFCEKHPKSTFNKFMKISIFKGDSNFTLVDGVFKEYRDAKVQMRKKMESEFETIMILKEYFGIINQNLL